MTSNARMSWTLRATAVLSLALALGACGAGRAHVARTRLAGESLRVELAETYVRKGAHDAAIPLLRRALADRPRDPHVRALYGVVLRERGLYPQADKELRLAVRLAPRRAEGWIALGILYDLMRRPADAERAHRRAIALAPSRAAAWNNLGFSLHVAGRTDEAIAALEHALALDPSMIVAYNNLGFAYGRRGDLAAAERCFRTAGGDAAARLNLAIVEEARGDHDAAQELVR